jgi:hypothetical protein
MDDGGPFRPVASTKPMGIPSFNQVVDNFVEKFCRVFDYYFLKLYFSAFNKN